MTNQDFLNVFNRICLQGEYQQNSASSNRNQITISGQSIELNYRHEFKQHPNNLKKLEKVFKPKKLTEQELENYNNISSDSTQSSNQNTTLKIVCMSDTHNLHEQIEKNLSEIPSGDVFIHAGDISRYGELKELKKFTNWIKKLNDKFKYKIVIAGNRDLLVDRKFVKDTKQHLLNKPDKIQYFNL